MEKQLFRFWLIKTVYFCCNNVSYLIYYRRMRKSELKRWKFNKKKMSLKHTHNSQKIFVHFNLLKTRNHSKIFPAVRLSFWFRRPLSVSSWKHFPAEIRHQKDVVMTPFWRIDVVSTSIKRWSDVVCRQGCGLDFRREIHKSVFMLTMLYIRYLQVGNP